MKSALLICMLLQLGLGYCKESKGREVSAGVETSLIGTVWEKAVAHGKTIGENYRSTKYDHLSLSEKKDAVIKNLCMQNAVAGAGVGIFGVFGAPAGIFASLALQVSLVSAIATLQGLDVHDHQVMYLMATVLVGDVATEALKNSLRMTGRVAVTQLFRTTGGRTLKRAIDAVILTTAKKILATVGVKKGVAALFGAVPVVGGIIGFATDGGMCYAVAQSMNFALLTPKPKFWFF